jgi:hypothetical protein
VRRLRTALAIALLGIMSVQLGGASGASAAEAAVPAPGQATEPRSAIAGWHVRKAQSNLCLVARAGSGERPVEQSACAEYSDQGWVFDYPFGGSTPFQLRNLDRNLCVVTRGSGESRAVVTTCNAGYADQLWTWYWDNTYGGYHFVNMNSGHCLVARGTSPAVQSTCGPYSDQVWNTY